MANKKIVVALVGNPNSGKTTIFNNLTGARQHVGNWPGVTVEKKEGSCTHRSHDIAVVDLPGVYSLTAYSPDEIVARNFIIESKPDVVVDIIDASNLERNLYLAVQLMEMEVPLILVLNMMDEAESKKYHIDVKALSQEIGLPVIPAVANRNKGMDDLLEEIVKISASTSVAEGVKIEYGREVENELDKLQKAISESSLTGKYSPRWLAIKLLEGDEEVMKRFQEVINVA